MKIFFQGTLTGPWASGWQRCETVRQIGGDVVPFCQSIFLERAQPSRWRRLAGRSAFKPEVIDAFNDTWLRMVLESRPDVAWLEWPKLLRRETLRRARSHLPRCRFVAFYDDNPFGGRLDELWQWELFLDAIPEFDLHLVKRNSDLHELRTRCARRAELFQHGYYEPIFHPRPENPAQFHPISFVGTALDHRVPFVRRLIARERLPVTVFGNRWEKTLLYQLHRSCFHPAVLAHAYADVIRCSHISLGFVSSSNRDEYSMRTFEIPACAGFLLAERTPAHQALFREGVEAEFFDSVLECADKARFYLRNHSVRARVAAAGCERCVKSDYSLRRSILQALRPFMAAPAISTGHWKVEPLSSTTRADP